LIAPAACFSCSDWLTVHSKSINLQEDLYANYNGYRTTLNGIYVMLGDTTLYGGNLMFGYTSFVGHSYQSASGSAAMAYNYIMQGEYGPIHPVFGYEMGMGLLPQSKRIWTSAYKTIAYCNDLIAHAHEKDTSFFPRGKEEKEMIIGEALAARALLHLDLVRLFAPTPLLDDGTPRIPYVSKFPDYYPTALPTMQVLDSIVADLTAAAAYLAYNDTVVNPMTAPDHFSDDGAALFFSRRGYRLNYVAVTGLLARAYLYKGDKANALRCANEAIKFSAWFPFTPVSAAAEALDTRPRKLPHDVLFAAYSTTLFQYWSAMGPALKNAGTGTGQLFENDGDDVRYLYLTSGTTSLKWASYSEASVSAASWNWRTLAPVIRASEMYYIAAECMAGSDLAGATSRLHAVRVARGTSRALNPASLEDFMDELALEYCREFIAEAQALFFFKRLNRPIYNGAATPISMGLVIPIPQGEYEYY
jgi:hypothetical protein